MDAAHGASEMASEGHARKPGELSPDATPAELSPDATPAPVVGGLPADAASPAPVELDGSSPVGHHRG